MFHTYVMKRVNLLRLLNFLNDTSERSTQLNKNIILSFLSKGTSVISGYLLVPICLKYLGKEKYGVWLTLSSLVGWFAFFEIGLGNGLRNQLSECLAIKDISKGKILVSTTYAIITIICFISSAIFVSIEKKIDWLKLFNTQNVMNEEMSILVMVVFNFFILRLVLKLIAIILYADQRPGVANMMEPIGTLFSLIAVYILTKIKSNSLILLGTIISGMPMIVFIVFSIYFYSGDYKNISPSFRYIDFKYAGELLNLGVKFFLIQISGIVLYQTSNIIIAQCFGPSEVTIYGIAYKLFSSINMLFTIIVIPFWSAFTEAWTLKDIDWIEKSIKRLIKLWLSLVVMGSMMLIFSSYIYSFWIGSNIKIPFQISLLLLIYFVLFTFGSIFTFFINGVGKITLQLYSSFIGALLFIPLSLYLINDIGTGIKGLIIAVIICNFYGPILAPIQYYKIIKEREYGIWAK